MDNALNSSAAANIGENTVRMTGSTNWDNRGSAAIEAKLTKDLPEIEHF